MGTYPEFEDITIVIRPADAATGIRLHDVFINGHQIGDTVPTSDVRPLIDHALQTEGIY